MVSDAFTMYASQCVNAVVRGFNKSQGISFESVDLW